MIGDEGDEEPRKMKKMERQKCYFALHVSVVHFAPGSSHLLESSQPSIVYPLSSAVCMRWGGKRLHIQVVGGEQPAELYSFLPARVPGFTH